MGAHNNRSYTKFSSEIEEFRFVTFDESRAKAPWALRSIGNRGCHRWGARPSVRPLSMRARRSLRLHKLLGLEADAAYARVRSSYQQKVRKCHPDACGTASAGNCDEFLKVQSAWEEYKDSASVRAAEGPAATSRTTRSELQMVLFKLKIDQGAETDHHPRAAARALATVPVRAFVRQ